MLVAASLTCDHGVGWLSTTRPQSIPRSIGAFSVVAPGTAKDTGNICPLRFTVSVDRFSGVFLEDGHHFIKVENRRAIRRDDQVIWLEPRLIGDRAAHHETDSRHDARPDLDFAQSRAPPTGRDRLGPTGIDREDLALAVDSESDAVALAADDPPFDSVGSSHKTVDRLPVHREDPISDAEAGGFRRTARLHVADDGRVRLAFGFPDKPDDDRHQQRQPKAEGGPRCGDDNLVQRSDRGELAAIGLDPSLQSFHRGQLGNRHIASGRDGTQPVFDAVDPPAPDRFAKPDREFFDD